MNNSQAEEILNNFGSFIFFPIDIPRLKEYGNSYAFYKTYFLRYMEHQLSPAVRKEDVIKLTRTSYPGYILQQQEEHQKQSKENGWDLILVYA